MRFELIITNSSFSYEVEMSSSITVVFYRHLVWNWRLFSSDIFNYSLDYLTSFNLIYLTTKTQHTPAKRIYINFLVLVRYLCLLSLKRKRVASIPIHEQRFQC